MIKQRNIQMADIQPINMTRFFGINKAEAGDTELKVGEASECENWRITSGYELDKMEGYAELFESLGEGKIQGGWYGKIGTTDFIIFNHAGDLYKRTSEGNVKIGEIADAPTTFFYFGSKLYMLDGTNYKSFDGTTLADVAGYVPKIAVGAPPTGGGTLFEQVNMLTGSKRMTFSPTEGATVFVLPETNVDSIDTVTENGVAVTTGITKETTAGTLTFSSGRTEGVDTIEIQWTKANTTNRDAILKNTKVFIYGGASDTRVFMYGNPDAQNREYFSGITTTPTAEYFPANNYNDIGSSQYAITGMARQYDRRIITLEKGAYYGTIDTFYDANNVLITTFPVYPLNSEQGNIAVGRMQVINNNPISICEDGIYEWISTNVRDERNAKRISDRVYADLKDLDLSTAVTIDWQKKSELWICIPSISKCWIYNYGNDTWYTRTNVKAYNFLIIDDELCFGSDGTIYRFDKDLRVDKGEEIIDAIHYTGFYGFGMEWLKKTISRLWISAKPETKFYLDISATIITSKGTKEIHIGTITQNKLDFNFMDFSNMSFEGDSFAKSFRLKTRAKDFAYFRLNFRSNDPIARATVLSAILNVTEGGEIK